MTNNMAIGPAMIIGGNEVQLNSKGKVQITNPKGKTVTLSKDQFLKQTVKNADKIGNGEDFEYKKDRKGLKIAGAVIGTAAVVTGVIYRKEIARYMKNFSFKKLWNDIKGLFGSSKKDKLKYPISNGTTPRNTMEAKTAKETLKAKNEAHILNAHRDVAQFDKMLARTKGAIHNNKQKMYEKLFATQK